jgi:mRNA interferase YafQ
MRTIEQIGQFKRDMKREAKGANRAHLAAAFVGLVEAIARDELLAAKYRDHALSGDWNQSGAERPPLLHVRR